MKDPSAKPKVKSKGVPADIEVMNTKDDLDAKEDAVLIKALGMLRAE